MTDATAEPLSRAATRAAAAPAQRAIAWWLLACCALVFAMVMLGGVTRLTGSGLSMVTWKPVTGFVPPLGEAAWQTAFDQYRKSPEFRDVNYWMTVSDFKRIYWLEFLHRLLGRVIGLAFLLPFLWFLVRRRIPRALAPQLAAMFLLGGAQGGLGWYMVASGLVSDPRVSQYRLAAHLGLAVLIYAYMLRVALRLLRPPPTDAAGVRAPIARAAMIATALVYLTMISGAFVAGLKAGFTYNTFPLMGGRWIPYDIWSMTPGWRNLFENVATVQFDHRVIAITTFCVVLGVWAAGARAVRGRVARRWLHAAGAMACVQVGLGISTLLLQVPTPLAAAHQAGALVLFSLLLGLATELSRAPSPAAAIAD